MRPAESFIAQPVRSLQTMLRVITEINDKIPTVIPDGIYGNTTRQAVAAYQRQASLPSTGVVNQETWESIVTAYEKAFIEVYKAQPIEILIDRGEIFSSGDSGPYIYFLQAMLDTVLEKNKSVFPALTGVMDENTIRLMNEFQRLAEIKQTKAFDKETWKHLVLHFTGKMHQIKSENNRIR